MDILNIIQKKTFKCIASLDLVNGKTFQISVTFKDGSSAIHKDSLGLRAWAALVQNVEYMKIEGKTDHCDRIPLGFFDLLGFRSGDAISYRDEKEVEKAILFS